MASIETASNMEKIERGKSTTPPPQDGGLEALILLAKIPSYAYDVVLLIKQISHSCVKY